MVYIGEFPYRLDFLNRKLLRLDVEGQVLNLNEAESNRDYYKVILDRDSRLPVVQTRPWAEESKSSFSVLILKDLLNRERWADKDFLHDMNRYSRDCGWNIHLGESSNPMKLSPRSEHLYPITRTQGLNLWVDVEVQQLGDRDVPHNQLPFRQLEEVDGGYAFTFLMGKNHWEIEDFPDALQMIDIRIPELVKIDPKGMARKYGFTIDELKGKSDFEVMVDQNAFNDRLKKGKLVTVDIQGQLFYVDHTLQMLRPKDRFLSKGIPFDQLEVCYSHERELCVFSYNEQTLRINPYDGTQSQIEDGCVIVELPSYYRMDPVGINLWAGADPMEQLKWVGVKSHFVAKPVDVNSQVKSLSPSVAHKSKNAEHNVFQGPALGGKRYKKRGRGLSM